VIKGSVYGGIFYLPSHPAADMHGLLRGVMRTNSMAYVNLALEGLGVESCRVMWREHLWAESASAVERLVTETHYGELMVSPLVSAYLNADSYRVLEKEYFRVPRTA
jgi:hypothetical protein